LLFDGLNADQYELITMRKDVNILDKKIREFKFVSLLLPLFCAKLANPIAIWETKTLPEWNYVQFHSMNLKF
jgi:hypothetical protein